MEVLKQIGDLQLVRCDCGKGMFYINLKKGTRPACPACGK